MYCMLPGSSIPSKKKNVIPIIYIYLYLHKTRAHYISLRL